MNTSLKPVLFVLVGCVVAGNAVAGELSADQISINANMLERDSGKNLTYLYNNNGTVNNSADDIALANTGSFSASDDTGYQLSGSKQFNNKWSINAAGLSTELSKADSFSNASRQLEIFRLPITNNFDSADSVTSSYSSKLNQIEINAVYRVSDSLDVFAGLNQVKLDERFKIISNDSTAAGATRATGRTRRP